MRNTVFTVVSILMLVLVVVGCNLRFGEPSAPEDETAVANIPPQDYVNYHWVSYTPTGYEPGTGKELSQAGITGDLYLLAQTGFTGLVTTTSIAGFDNIPQMAKANGFEAVIMGINDPKNEAEIDLAITAAPFVDAYAVGHCGLGTDYTIDDLQAAVSRLSIAGRSITIWEKPSDYVQVMSMCTFMSPVVNAYEEGYNSPISAMTFTVQEFVNVASLDATKITMLFGVGYPTAGGDFANEEMQLLYYQNMPIDFPWCYQEAFDQPWREGPTLQHYGLFDQFRNPKMYISNYSFGD